MLTGSLNRVLIQIGENDGVPENVNFNFSLNVSVLTLTVCRSLFAFAL